MIDFESILLVIENGEGISRDDMFKKTRKREILFSRQLVQYFCKVFNLSSLATIGKKTGDKDHATVLHSYKTINNLIDTDKHIAEKVKKYHSQLLFTDKYIKKKNSLMEMIDKFRADFNLMETRFIELKLKFNDLENFVSMVDNPII